MLQTSEVYKEIMQTEHSFEWKAVIDGVEYDESQLVSARTQSEVFGSSGFTVGECVCSQLDLSLLKPAIDPPRMAEINMFVRVTDGTRVSEWIPKGTYFISTRTVDTENYETDVLDIHAYDAMLKTEQDACTQGDQSVWPKTDIQAVNYIAGKIGVWVDSRNLTIMNKGYSIPYPGYGEDGYSLREVLGYIASMYAGCFVITDNNELRLIAPYMIPEETFLITNEFGDVLIFGEDAIIWGIDE